MIQSSEVVLRRASRQPSSLANSSNTITNNLANPCRRQSGSVAAKFVKKILRRKLARISTNTAISESPYFHAVSILRLKMHIKRVQLAFSPQVYAIVDNPSLTPLSPYGTILAVCGHAPCNRSNSVSQPSELVCSAVKLPGMLQFVYAGGTRLCSESTTPTHTCFLLFQLGTL